MSCTHFFYFVLKVSKCLCACCSYWRLQSFFLACFNSLFCFSRLQTWAYFQPLRVKILSKSSVKILDPSILTLKGRHTCDRISFNYLNVHQRNIKQLMSPPWLWWNRTHIQSLDHYDISVSVVEMLRARRLVCRTFWECMTRTAFKPKAPEPLLTFWPVDDFVFTTKLIWKLFWGSGALTI